MRVLILGSEGFIGRYLVQFALKQGWEVIGCDQIEAPVNTYLYYKVSLLSADIEQLFINQTYDVCINAAGSGNVAYSFAHPLSDFEANVVAVTNVLETIRKFNPECKYLHISSAAVYGNPQQLPVLESAATQPLSPYGWHKLMAEMACREYHTLYGLKIAMVRPFSVYGEGLRKQLLWDICNKLNKADSIQLFGTGNESRDFIHASDLAGLIYAIVEHATFACDVFNAASGSETCIRDVASLFEQDFGPQKSISFSGEVRSGDPLNWRADVSKSREIGFHNATPLQEGLRGYIRWFHASRQ